MIKVEFTESNSGGWFRMGADDWATLADAGWVVDGRSATILAGSVDAAKAQWAATLPHFDPDDDGCDCCGQPFRFDEWED